MIPRSPACSVSSVGLVCSFMPLCYIAEVEVMWKDIVFIWRIFLGIVILTLLARYFGKIVTTQSDEKTRPIKVVP